MIQKSIFIFSTNNDNADYTCKEAYISELELINRPIFYVMTNLCNGFVSTL